MPTVRANGVDLHYVEAGDGPETVVLSHSYLVDHRHFAAQIEALAREYRVLAYDHRGHGGSEEVPGSYDMEEIYADGLAFVEAVASPPCHWVGLSTGGFVGLRIAARRPELLGSLVVMSAAGDAEPRFNRLKYSLLLAVVGRFGYRPVLGQAMKAMFGSAFLRDPQRRDELAEWRRRLQANPPAAMIRFGRAIFWRDDVRPELERIAAPTLVLAGELDRAVTPARAHDTARRIPGALFETVPGSGHLSTVEAPGWVSTRLAGFLRDGRGAPGTPSR